MGWNSWDYGPTVVEDEVKANADYMAKYLKKFGWQYIVIDIRWYVENDKSGGYNEVDPRYVMDEYGRYLPALNRFPSAANGKGFKPIADYIHRKGLKFGIHMMRGIPVIAVKQNTPVLGTNVKASDIYSPQGQCGWLRDNYTIDSHKEGAQAYYNSLFQLFASCASWAAFTGRGEPILNATARGGKLTVGGKEYKNGISANATSIIEYDLPEGVTRFKTKAGLDNGTSAISYPGQDPNSQSVRQNNAKFLVFIEDPAGPVPTETAPINVKFDQLGLTGTYSVTDLWTGEKLGKFTNEFTGTINRHGAGLYRIH